MLAATFTNCMLVCCKRALEFKLRCGENNRFSLFVFLEQASRPEDRLRVVDETAPTVNFAAEHAQGDSWVLCISAHHPGHDAYNGPNGKRTGNLLLDNTLAWTVCGAILEEFGESVDASPVGLTEGLARDIARWSEVNLNRLRQVAVGLLPAIVRELAERGHGRLLSYGPHKDMVPADLAKGDGDIL